jgi:DNA modification methylase
MKRIGDKTVDMVLTDPPYGTTACKWDSVIHFEPMWKELKRICKGPMLLFGSEPFSSHLRMSNISMFRYSWIWEKTKAGQFLNAKRRPLQAHEIIDVFYDKTPPYYPQMSYGKPFKRFDITNGDGNCYGSFSRSGLRENKGQRNPRTVIKFSNPNNGNFHPTQKPTPLLEYLIKTYTIEGQIVLDFTMGSGSTGVACKNLNRKFIGIEKDPHYFEIAKNRISNWSVAESVQHSTVNRKIVGSSPT